MSIDNLRKDIRMRADSDKMLSTAWIIPLLLPIIFLLVWIPSLIIGTIIAPGAAVVLAVAVLALFPIFIIGGILYIYALYKLIKRRNTHFTRQHFLSEDLVAMVKGLATKKGVNIESSLASCERSFKETKTEEGEKSAALWTILSLVTGLAALYVYYFLMKDFYKHERREDAFWEDISRLLASVGVSIPAITRRATVLPNRSFALYFILSILTLGIFVIYWFYVLIKDPNEHFRHHVVTEDAILTQLETTTI